VDVQQKPTLPNKALFIIRLGNLSRPFFGGLRGSLKAENDL